MKNASRTAVARTSLRGRSGIPYDFEVYLTPARFRDVEAVYVYARFEPNLGEGARYTPLSIGQTAELGKETSRHPRWSCLEARGCNCICILPAAAEEKRLAIEADLRAAYPAPCDDEGR